MDQSDSQRVEELIERMKEKGARKWEQEEIDDLVAFANHSDEEVAQPAIDYLSDSYTTSLLTPHIETIVDIMVVDGEIPSDRSKLFNTLEDIGGFDPATVGRISDFLFEHHTNDYFESAAINDALASAALADGSIIDRLVDRIQDPKAESRRESAEVLAAISEKDSDAVESVIPFLLERIQDESEDAGIRMVAIEAVDWYIHDHPNDVNEVESIIPTLLEIVVLDEPKYETITSSLRGAAAEALAEYASIRPQELQDEVDRFVSALDTDDSDLRTSALRCLESIAADNPQAVEPFFDEIHERVTDEREIVQLAAVQVLAELADEHPSRIDVDPEVLTNLFTYTTNLEDQKAIGTLLGDHVGDESVVREMQSWQYGGETDELVQETIERIQSRKSDTESQIGAISEKSEEATCPSCGTTLEGTEKFCPDCGHELTESTCPSCGTDLKGDESFCPECGHELAE